MRHFFIFFVGLALSSQSAVAQDGLREWRFYVDTVGSADRVTRDIDAVAVTVSTPVVQYNPFSFGFQAGFVATTGASIEPEDFEFSPADANGVFAGGYIRISPPDEEFITPFAEGGIAFLVFDKSFPQHPSLEGAEGRLYGKFDIRWGVDLAIRKDLEVELAFALNHISNGSGFGPQNINFDGVGLSLGIVKRW